MGAVIKLHLGMIGTSGKRPERTKSYRCCGIGPHKYGSFCVTSTHPSMKGKKCRCR